MCDQTTIDYKHGDIVWVKLGSCWWPGEVQALANLPKEWLSDFKKAPLAAVKFFEEDKYEYVKSIDKIYSYNCVKKNEFIKKGLDLYRAKNTFMKKFPIDVATAESKTGGDPEITNSPIFAPEKKTNYAALLFGSPQKGKKPRKSVGSGKKTTPAKSSSTSAKASTIVTHPRFIGRDDHEVRILVQPTVEEEPKEDVSNYSCSLCGFKTTRIDVIVFHNKSHIQGVYNTQTMSSKKLKKPIKKEKKLKMTKSKTSSIKEDLELIDKGLLLGTESSDDDSLQDWEIEEATPKRKRRRVKKKNTKKVPNQSTPVTTTPSNTIADIRNNLLAEWEEDSESEEVNVSSITMESDTSSSKVSIAKKEKPVEETKPDEKNDANKSCFDFDEEEENEEVVGTSLGRKIPRVIPPQPMKQTSIEQDINNSNESQTSEKSDALESSSNLNQTKDPDIDAFRDILEETAVPVLPDLLQSFKCEQDIASKAINVTNKEESNLSNLNSAKEQVENNSVKKQVETKLIEEQVNNILMEEKVNKDLTKEPESTSSEEQVKNSLIQEELKNNSAEKESKNNSVILIDNSSIKEQIGDHSIKEQIRDHSIIEQDKLEALFTETNDPSLSDVNKEVERKLKESQSKSEPEIVKDYHEKVISSNIEELTDTLKKPDVEIEIGQNLMSNEKYKNINVPSKSVVEISEITDKVAAKDSKEMAARLINPKKRFVKSFEDYEQQLSNESNLRTEASKTPTPNEEVQVKSNISIDKPISKSDSTLSESIKNIEFSKLKTQLKSKLESTERNAEQILPQTKKSIANKSAASHKQTPEKRNSTESSNSRSHLIEWLATKSKGQRSTSSPDVALQSTSVSQPPITDASELINAFSKDDNIAMPPVDDNLSSMTSTLSQELNVEEKPKLELKEISATAPSVDNVDNSVYDTTSSEDLSALSTLAAVSELSTNFGIQSNRFEESKLIESHSPSLSSSENVTTEEKSKVVEGGCLTFVTEDVLADNQVEITNVQPVTLSNFSVDFSDSVRSVSEPQKVQNVAQVSKSDQIEEDKLSQFDLSTNVCTDAKSEDSDIALAFCTEAENTVQVNIPEYNSTSKLLEILTDGKSSEKRSENLQKSTIVGHSSNTSNRNIDFKSSPFAKEPSKSTFNPKNSKFVIKSAVTGKQHPSFGSKSSKPIILSDQSIKPISETETVSVQKVTSKKATQNVEDIDTFIIQKHAKRPLIPDNLEEITANRPLKKPNLGGKAKILQQTIIKPDGDIIQPFNTIVATPKSATSEINSSDDNIFDINSMPIVLGDQILTAECIENIPMSTPNTSQSAAKVPVTNVAKIRSDPVKLLNKTTAQATSTTVFKTYSQKLVKSPKIYPSSSTKITKPTSAVISRPGKTEKFIIVPPGTNTTTQSKYTLGKKSPLIKKQPIVSSSSPATASKVQTTNSEPSGNKIMIVTNQQGQQSRVLLTPAQQKYLGYQPTGTKSVKSTLKGNILQKSTSIKGSVLSAPKGIKAPGMVSHTIINSSGEIISTSTQSVVASDGQVLMSLKSPQQLRTMKSDFSKSVKKLPTQKLLLQESSSMPKTQQKTIVIKNQRGHVIKRIQATDDALLEQQVAEQVQAIKASGSFDVVKTQQEINSPRLKSIIKRSYPKKLPAVESNKALTSKPSLAHSPSMTKLQKYEASVPPLAPISPKKSDNVPQTMAKVETKPPELKQEQTPQKPLNQLIIQDSLGNQTTITEGQILALPSGETVDGQPQSYMLVTLDESGNLTPLNNEALLSLDPNLCLGGDLSNMVLQIDEGAVKADSSKSTEINATTNIASTSEISENKPEPKKEQHPVAPAVIPKRVESSIQDSSVISKENLQFDSSIRTTESLDNSRQSLDNVQTVTCNIGNDPNQQLIITGDPVSTQKFIESLTEGNQDLANLLANAEGNILIQTDEQQILINTEANNQILLPMSNDNLNINEGQGNPIFATQSNKSQDILAAALADTDVFQSENTTQSKIVQSQLSPSGGLYPPSVANVLETTLSLSSPIMTPLEVPSSNNKKIPDEETDLLTTEVPKNVDLPITITDPNISQTVAQQQVASLIANELTTNLELPLAITEAGTSLTSSDMSSPSFVYSLPSLDESDIHQKAFTTPMSMPLLNEESHGEVVSGNNTNNSDDVKIETSETSKANEVPTLQLTPSVESESSNSLFEPNNVLTRDSTNGKELQSTSAPPFLGAIDSEEGLCTLGGAMCSSLSEPPPDMFDLSLEGNTYSAESVIKEQTSSSSVISSVSEMVTTSSIQETKVESSAGQDPSITEQSTIEEFEKFDTFDTESRNNSTSLSSLPLNSESNSPAINIDESSSEIPVQPQIVTDLSSSSSVDMQETNTDSRQTNKRPLEENITEEEVKKPKLD